MSYTTLVLKDHSWVSVIDVAWKLKKLAEQKVGGQIDSRTIELIYGPAVAESLIRTCGETVAKLTPSAGEIKQTYLKLGKNAERASIVDSIATTDSIAEEFALISGDRNVAVGASMPTKAQVICILAHRLEPVARQEFQQAFVWDGLRRALVFNDDEIALWNSLERELGVGILAAVWNAQDVVSDIKSEELATAILRKYGIPTLVEGVEVFSCHWCGTAPCSCGGGKAASRKVGYDVAAQNLHRGPVDTQKGMYFSYAWPNIGRSGIGPFRALVEAAVEKGAVMADGGSLFLLQQRFGPLLLPQQRHFAEVISRFGKGQETMRKARLSELADGVHWPFAGYGPGLFDHAAGLEQALLHVAEYCGVGLEIPEGLT
ncbi:MAG: hypothetical protein Q7S86_03415 [bacterium]|nr:hypothetical protein [bacterium]